MVSQLIIIFTMIIHDPWRLSSPLWTEHWVPCKERTRWAPRRPNATAASKTATCRGRSLNPGYFGLTEDKLEEWSMFLNVTCKHGVWTMLKIRLKDLHNITGRTIQNWGADWDWSWHYLKWPHNLARPRSKRSIPLISSFYFSCNSMIPHIRRDFICWISATPSNWVSPLGHSWSISGCSVTYHLPAGFRKTPWTPLPPQKKWWDPRLFWQDLKTYGG